MQRLVEARPPGGPRPAAWGGGVARLRVGVLFGGRSGEHEVSLASAASVLRALDPARYEAVPLGISRDGRWIVQGDPLDLLRSLAPLPAPDARDPLGFAAAVPRLQALDVVFPVLHGPFGEDGTVQGLLDLLDVPYVGAGVASSAVGMDKVLMKRAFRDAGLPVVESAVVLRGDWAADPAGTMRQVEAAVGLPCFVKPANMGSSVGVAKCRTRAELEAGLAAAAVHDRKILAERALDCREIEVSVLGNDRPEASVVGEIVPKRDWYDYEAKYTEGMCDVKIPAPLEPAQAAAVRRIALAAYRALDCAGMARVDFFVERGNGAVWLNEINTIPGFTSTSVYPKLWEATGLPYPALLHRLVDLALERHRDRAGRAGAQGTAGGGVA
jgi:D-alanine-D-alanine ligase